MLFLLPQPAGDALFLLACLAPTPDLGSLPEEIFEVAGLRVDELLQMALRLELGLLRLVPGALGLELVGCMVSRLSSSALLQPLPLVHGVLEALAAVLIAIFGELFIEAREVGRLRAL